MHDPSSRPVRAVIDVGSKSVRLLVARQLAPDAFEVVDEERFDSRLAEGQAGGDLTPEAIERGVRALRVVTQVAASYRPMSVVAVGTQALRAAPNAGEFVDRVSRETGTTIRVLDEHEEAIASFLGVANSHRIEDGCIVDIGGGSLELIEVVHRQVTRTLSVPLGSIYATERFLRSDPPSPKEVRELRKAVRAAVAPLSAAPVLFGAGGAIRNLARIARLRRRYPVTRLHGYALARGDLRRLTRSLVAVRGEERRRLAGMNVERAATLPAAAVVIEEVMDAVGARSLVVSGQGLREGILWQDIRGDDALLPDVRASSVAGLAAGNGVDVAGAEPVARTASHLFDATALAHGLGQPERELLVHAAHLAEVGIHVDFYNRERHAEYLVNNGALLGFDHREAVILAAVLRWSLSGTPDLRAYRGIVGPGDERRVQVLGALLGVARAVRRRVASPVESLDATLAGNTLRLRIVSAFPLDAEEHALERPLRRLESALKIESRLSVKRPR